PGEAAAPKKETKSRTQNWMGARVMSFSAEAAEQYRQPADAQGVLVSDVDPGSQADEMGLIPGDLIRAVNQVPTPDGASFSKAVERVKLAEGIVLDVLR